MQSESNQLQMDRSLNARSEHELYRQILDSALWGPWREINSRPKKEIRSEFVNLGFSLACPRAPKTAELQRIEILTQAIETLHLGSLIVDDIQDNSLERRGAPTLHRQIGMPLALNLGNFLYFEALDLLRRGPFTELQRLALFESVTETMWYGHQGQALDLAVRIDQVSRESAPAICHRSLELKSGALMALALKMGALVGDAKFASERLQDFGVRFGAVLQMFDDVGNLKIDSDNPKHLEDLMLRRPSWVWSVLAEFFPAEVWRNFCAAVAQLPATAPLSRVLTETRLREKAFAAAREQLHLVLAKFKNDFQLPETSEPLKKAQELGERLTHAYQ